MIKNQYEQEVNEGTRFEFGKNWQQFLATLNEDRIMAAEQSLKEMLAVEDLADKSFLDIGSGSGLSSLTARRLGARVHSFDYDPYSVACTRELKQLYFPDDSDWVIEQGSALDTDYLTSLGKFDIVYSWGVLHHTGAMWTAIDNAATIVPNQGLFHIAIYLKTGFAPRWLQIKQFYNRQPGFIKRLMVWAYAVFAIMLMLIRKQNPWLVIKEYHKQRGMSWLRDVEDWLGGLPYEYASPQEIKDFLEPRGFTFLREKGMEYVFVRTQTP